MTTDRIAAIALAILGAAAAWQASRLPYWVEQAPGPGFLPYWLGAALAVTSAVQALRAASVRRAETGDAPRMTSRTPALFVLTAMATALVPYVGFGLAIGLLTGAIAWTLDRGRPVQAVVAAAVMPVVVWLVFVRWLDVPFPR